MATSRNDRFARGSGMYTCNSCGKRTRQVDPDSASCGLCGMCYHRSCAENTLSDQGVKPGVQMTEGQVLDLIYSAETQAEVEKLYSTHIATNEEAAAVFAAECMSKAGDVWNAILLHADLPRWTKTWMRVCDGSCCKMIIDIGAAEFRACWTDAEDRARKVMFAAIIANSGTPTGELNTKLIADFTA